MKLHLSQLLGTVLTLSGKTEPTPGVVSYDFEPSKSAWDAGQYYVYWMPGVLDKKFGFRPFTVSSAPKTGKLQITTRMPESPSAFKRKLDALKPGAKVYAVGPFGFFTMPRHAEHIVMLAGGIGVTPFQAQLTQLGTMDAWPDITLLYSSRDDEPLYAAELDELAAAHPQFKWHAITEPQRLDAATIATYIKEPTKATYLVSGPPAMVKGVSQTLSDDLKVPGAQIKRDSLKGYPWPLA